MSHPAARSVLRRTSMPVAVLVTASTLALAAGPPAQAATGERKKTIPIMLTGAQVPGSGDQNGRGFALLTFDPSRKTVCYDVSWRRLDGRVTAMHLHAGKRGATGPHHVDLLNEVKIPGRSASVRDCVKVEDGGHETGMSAAEKIREVIANPRAFYLNVHTTAKPDGAVRGQLR